MSTNGKIPPKKPYHTPKFIIYGDLGKLTKTSKMIGQDDGGKGNNKTGG
jgi:hypothetical protein